MFENSFNRYYQAYNYLQKKAASTSYIPYVQKSIIKRMRKSPVIDTVCQSFMETAFTPSR